MISYLCIIIILNTVFLKNYLNFLQSVNYIRMLKEITIFVLDLIEVYKI